MSKYVVAIVAGVGVAFLVALGLSAVYAAAGDGGSRMPLIAGVMAGAFTSYIMANLAGNRAVATADATAKAHALTFAPPPGKALIYLYREGFVGKAAGLNVSVDGKVVAQLKSPRFTCVAVAPGEHRVSAAFGGLAGAQNTAGESAVTLAAGQSAAFRFGISMGLLQNTVAVTPMPDLEAAKVALARMPMTVPDAAEA